MSQIPDEIVERVARAIILEVADRTSSPDDLAAVWKDGKNRDHACAMARAALTASWWVEMRDELLELAEVAEFARGLEVDCKWDESERHCRGACEALGCMKMKIARVSATLQVKT